ILDFQIVQNDIDIKNACMEAKLNIISDKSFTAIIEIRDSANNLFAQKEINLKPGNNDCSVKFNIPEPKLWWCNGKGEQPLYKISAGLLKDNAVLDCKNMTTGLREIELVQENDSIGRSFFFTLNGKQVYIKGANYIPQDNFPSRVGADVYKRIIADAREAGINMLRVWGGGIYEEDIFYDLCDQNGIMVWQDFMFSCNMYPGDKDFLSNVENEVNQNIQRLRNHACIAVWCGNNEVENGWNDWEWQKLLGYSTEDSQKVWNDYQELFYQLIPRLVRENDPGRQYIPTSPQYGWGHQENFTRGDSHYWGVWWGMEPFEVYNEKFGRFMSEYGFQSMPDMRTIRFFAGDSVISVSDPVILSHQKHPEGFETIHKYMERDYPVPESLDEFVYVSQMLQAEGMKTAIEAHRRNMPVCMGTLFWQFNDCWPVTSWSGIDFFGRKKALYYFLKKLYLNVIGSVYENNGYTELYIINDGFQETDYNVELKIMGFNGNTLWSDTINGHTCANSSAVVYSLRTSDILAGLNPNSILLHYCILSGDVRKYTGNFYFAKTKELDIKPTDIDTAWVHVNGEYMLKLETSYLIKNLQIFSDDIDIECSDNYFDVIPGYPEQVKITVIEGSFSPLKIKFRSIGDIR
ncbi:MAG: glycoside hydrolase family 2 protein, partial [Bacteroidota bacterium]